ncbi:MAG: copper amine oxidase N-terminal domain-containing protein [Clostridiales bacterium]|nr:copper amine oxidase N-terminal domain-containing protein [Clostridiales bacterium]
MKKSFIIVLTVFTSFIFSACAFGATPAVKSAVAPYEGKGYIEYASGAKEPIDSGFKALFINGSLVEAANILTENSRTLAPLRLISEALGASVTWDEGTQTVSVRNSGTAVTLAIGSLSAEVNGNPVTLDAAPKIIGDRTYLPLRFISESLNSTVDYYDPSIHGRDKCIIYGIPSVFIDSRDSAGAKTISEAGDDLKVKCLAALEAFKGSLPDSQRNAISSEIKTGIDAASYISEISSYYKFKVGLYEALYDKYTGESSFAIENRNISFKKIDAGDPDLYSNLYASNGTNDILAEAETFRLRLAVGKTTKNEVDSMSRVEPVNVLDPMTLKRSVYRYDVIKAPDYRYEDLYDSLDLDGMAEGRVELALFAKYDGDGLLSSYNICYIVESGDIYEYRSERSSAVLLMAHAPS